MNQVELYQKAISTGDQKILQDLIESYGKPRKPISPLIFVLKEDKEKEENNGNINSGNDGRC